MTLFCHSPLLTQVIYKKFQIGCAIVFSGTVVQNEDSLEIPIQIFNYTCEAQMFTVGSQVSVQASGSSCHSQTHWLCAIGHPGQSGLVRYWTSRIAMCVCAHVCICGCVYDVEGKAGLGECGGASLTFCELWCADVLHNPHHGFCLCLPPGGAAHLHRALSVSG